jgi:hypothetical protein
MFRLLKATFRLNVKEYILCSVIKWTISSLRKVLKYLSNKNQQHAHFYRQDMLYIQALPAIDQTAYMDARK